MKRIAFVTILYLGLVPAASGSSRSDLARAVPAPARPATAAAQPTADTLTIKQIAVRQGDAAVIQGPCGELGLIDTNRFREQEVLDVLDGFGSRALEWISVSHYDADHLGGIVGVATAAGVSVERAHDRGGDRTAHDTQTYRAYFDWATSAATTRVPVDIGDSFSLCSGDQSVIFELCPRAPTGPPRSGLPSPKRTTRGSV